jgi:cytoskeletal protein CcmA (bactofilin family)
MNEPPNRWNPETRPETPPPPDATDALLASHDGREPGEPGSDPFAATKTKSEPIAIEDLANLELQAIVGAGSAFSGTLSFAGQARIDGNLEGVAQGGALLVIGHGASVRGRLEARQVIVLGGKVEADIIASQSIELHVPAEVTGDLRSPQIYMDRGVQFQGTCDMTGAPPAVAPVSATEPRE